MEKIVGSRRRRSIPPKFVLHLSPKNAKHLVKRSCCSSCHIINSVIISMSHFASLSISRLFVVIPLFVTSKYWPIIRNNFVFLWILPSLADMLTNITSY